MENKNKLVGRLIGVLYRQSNIYFQNELKALGLGPSQGKALMFIHLNERVISKHIATYYSLDKGSVTSLINGLVKNKFVIKENHPLDKRSSYLTLTDKALEIMPRLQKIFENWSNSLLKDIPKKEQDQLVLLLEKMIANT